MGVPCTDAGIELCNGLDDDCDGVIDNGTDLELCGKPGFVCRAGECLVAPQGDGGLGEIIIGDDPGSVDGTSPSAETSTACSFGFARPSNGKPGAILLLLGLGLALGRVRSRVKERSQSAACRR